VVPSRRPHGSEPNDVTVGALEPCLQRARQVDGTDAVTFAEVTKTASRAARAGPAGACRQRVRNSDGTNTAHSRRPHEGPDRRTFGALPAIGHCRLTAPTRSSARSSRG
jgi:hypothetical protein